MCDTQVDEKGQNFDNPRDISERDRVGGGEPHFVENVDRDCTFAAWKRFAAELFCGEFAVLRGLENPLKTGI